jgi:hypothetical protein
MPKSANPMKIWHVAVGKRLTNPNNKFSAMLNCGGSIGSQRHLLGVHVIISQPLLSSRFSGTQESLFFFFSSELLVKTEA